MYLHLIPTEFFYICLYFIPQIVKSLNWILWSDFSSHLRKLHILTAATCVGMLYHICAEGAELFLQVAQMVGLLLGFQTFFQHFFSFDNIMFCRFFSCKHYFWLYFQFGKLIFPYQGSGPNFWIQSLNLDIDINPFLLLQSAVPVCCLF